LRWPGFPFDQEEKQVIVQGPAGRRAFSVGEKEVLLRFALTAPHTPWVSVFRLGGTCARGKIISWFPCSLLISAVNGSRRVAMEYRSWLPSTSPRFDCREPRRRFAEFAEQVQPGTWISRDSAEPNIEDLFLRDSRVLWDDSENSEIHADPVYFPRTSAVPALDAARTIRAFCRTGQPADYVAWTPNSPQVASNSIDLLSAVHF
jgi:hypothetical protein